MKRILTAFLCAVLLFCTSCSYSAVPKSDGVTPLEPDNEIPRTIGLLNPDSEVRIVATDRFGREYTTTVK